MRGLLALVGLLSVGSQGDNYFTYFDQAVNYTTASERCRDLGPQYHLATINSAYELANILLKITARKRFYIGLHRQAKRDNFTWMDNSEVNFVNWNNGEPNGDKGKKREECVEVYNEGFLGTGKWNDAVCDLARHFLCQGPKGPLAPTPVTLINPCKKGYQLYRDSYYKFDSVHRTWDQANRFCQADGATVVSMRDPYEFYFVHQMIFRQMQPKLNGRVWTGLTTHKKIPGMFIWSDNSPVTYVNWGKNEPQRGKDEGCVAMERVTGKWQDTKCADTLPVVCKISTPPTLPPVQIECDKGWIPFSDMCYRLSDREVIWNEANRHCRRKGATLVSIHSGSLNNYLASAVLSRTNLKVGRFWIGLFRNDTTGEFSWADDSVFNFTNWREGEPNNHDEDEGCVEFFDVTGFWNDRHCSSKNGYICMRQGKLDKPKWSPYFSKTATVVSQLNKSMEFVLHVIANPPPTNVTWFAEDNQLATDQGFSASKVNDMTYTLSKKAVSLADYGEYSVEVTNAVGVSVFTFNLTQPVPPHTPCCLRMVNITAVSVTLTFKSNFSGGIPQTFTVEYREDDEVWHIAAEGIPDPGFSRSVVQRIKGLRSNTSYEFRVKSVNFIGSSSYGDVLQVKTRAAPVTKLGTNIWIIVGVAVGLTVLLVILVVLVMLRRRNKACFSDQDVRGQNNSRRNQEERESTTPDVNPAFEEGIYDYIDLPSLANTAVDPTSMQEEIEYDYAGLPPLPSRRTDVGHTNVEEEIEYDYAGLPPSRRREVGRMNVEEEIDEYDDTVLPPSRRTEVEQTNVQDDSSQFYEQPLSAYAKLNITPDMPEVTAEHEHSYTDLRWAQRK